MSILFWFHPIEISAGHLIEKPANGGFFNGSSLAFPNGA
jgi:hypothetical protein